MSQLREWFDPTTNDQRPALRARTATPPASRAIRPTTVRKVPVRPTYLSDPTSRQFMNVYTGFLDHN